MDSDWLLMRDAERKEGCMPYQMPEGYMKVYCCVYNFRKLLGFGNLISRTHTHSPTHPAMTWLNELLTFIQTSDFWSLCNFRIHRIPTTSHSVKRYELCIHWMRIRLISRVVSECERNKKKVNWVLCLTLFSPGLCRTRLISINPFMD